MKSEPYDKLMDDKATEGLRDTLQRCCWCPHRGIGVTFQCDASEWHCHYRGQKAKLREWGIE